MITNDNVTQPFELYPDVLSPATCAALIAKFDQNDKLTRGASNLAREVLQANIPMEHDLYSKVYRTLYDANSLIWNFKIEHFEQEFYFLKYPPGGHFNAWHIDTNRDYTSRRKLSISIQLSNPDYYSGGDLLIMPTAPNRHHLDAHAFRERGTAIVFPSFMSHKITPIENGTRYALIAWLCGPPFV